MAYPVNSRPIRISGTRIPSPQAARIALRPQQMWPTRPGVMRAVDRLAGSYFMESVTDDFEAQIRQKLVPFQHDTPLIRGRQSLERAEVAGVPGRFHPLSNLLGWNILYLLSNLLEWHSSVDRRHGRRIAALERGDLERAIRMCWTAPPPTRCGAGSPDRARAHARATRISCRV
jgi:methylmalonyl-CoA mutase